MIRRLSVMCSNRSGNWTELVNDPVNDPMSEEELTVLRKTNVNRGHPYGRPD